MLVKTNSDLCHFLSEIGKTLKFFVVFIVATSGEIKKFGMLKNRVVFIVATASYIQK